MDTLAAAYASKESEWGMRDLRVHLRDLQIGLITKKEEGEMFCFELFFY